MRTSPCLLPALLVALGCASTPPASQVPTAVAGGRAEIRLPNGSIYRGEVRDGVLEGHGRMEWKDGSFAEGEFHDGRLNGRGRWRSRTGDTYEGHFANGEEDGHGVRVWSSGERYEGEYRDGLENGRGTYTFDDGSVYTGEFADGVFDGHGVLRLADGSPVYEGHWRKGKMSGHGVLHYADGRVYEGELADGELHGHGRYVNKGGDVFEGEFVRGSFTGHGTWVHRGEDSRYEGEFADWKFQGHGVWKAEDGRRYEGEFADDRFEGPGRWEDAHGEVYVGGFSEGSYDGEGTLTWIEEGGRRRTAHGVWSRGRYVRGDADDLLPDPALAPEAVLFAQPERIERATREIEASRPGVPDLYFVGFAAWGSQGVFGREVHYAERLFRESLGSEGHSLVLVNDPATVRDAPLATASNLERALVRVGSRMDPREDILFLFLDSHGSPGQLAVRLGDLPLTDLRPDMLRHMLDRAGITWRVIVVSSCYSGSFVDDLRDDHSLVITAAAADRRSFGCSDEAEFSEFGRAFFQDAVPQTRSFEAAFEKARQAIHEREEKEGVTPSEPQIAVGDAIRGQLARWRDTLDAASGTSPAAPRSVP